MDTMESGGRRIARKNPLLREEATRESFGHKAHAAFFRRPSGATALFIVQQLSRAVGQLIRLRAAESDMLLWRRSAKRGDLLSSSQ